MEKNVMKEQGKMPESSGAGYTPSPILSWRYAAISVGLMLLRMAYMFACPALAYFFWDRLALLPTWLVLGLIVVYVTLLVRIFATESLSSRNYLKKRLLEVLRARGATFKLDEDWWFVDLLPPDLKVRGLDTAYAVGFLHLPPLAEGGGKKGSICRQEYDLFLLSDVLELKLRAFQVESVDQVVFRGETVTRLRYSREGDESVRELLLGDREAPNSVRRREFNKKLNQRIAAALDVETRPSLEVVGSETLSAEQTSLPQTFAVPLDLFGTRVTCTEDGISMTRKWGRGGWSIAWEDILKIDLTLGVQPNITSMLLTTDDGCFLLTSLRSLNQIAAIVRKQVDLRNEIFLAQEEMEFHYPRWLFRETRRAHYLALGFFVLIFAQLFVLGPGNILDFLGRMINLPILSALVLPAVLVLITLPFAFSRNVFTKGFKYRRMKRAFSVKLSGDCLTITSADQVVEKIRLSYIRKVRETSRRVVVQTLDERKIILLPSLGRLGLLLGELEKRCGKETTFERRVESLPKAST